jgi:hypothetical protein
MPLRVLSIALVSLMFLPLTTRAQAPATPEERSERLRVFRSEFRKELARRKRDEPQEAALRQKEAEQWERCMPELRSGTAELAPVLLCVRGALTLELAALRKTQRSIAELAGASGEGKAAAARALEGLAEALRAIVSGIDTEVLGSSEELALTLQNLLQRYRLPAWLALAHLRAERMLGWIAALRERLLSIREEEALTEEASGALDAAEQCLEEPEKLLESGLRSNDYKESKEYLSQAYGDLLICIELLRKVQALNAVENEK